MFKQKQKHYKHKSLGAGNTGDFAHLAMRHVHFFPLIGAPAIAEHDIIHILPFSWFYFIYVAPYAVYKSKGGFQ